MVDAWLEHENVRVVQETEEHARLWSELLRGAGSGGDLTTDAWIAAIAIAHGASVLTLDSDFARFPSLRWENPLHP
jgi:predicted nucleic acid-binding protein